MQKHALAVAALALAAGCASTAAEGPPVVVGKHWVGRAEGIDAKMQPRLEFLREGRVTGYTGCNMLSGSWRAEGNDVRLGPVIATKRMCIGPEGDVEQRVLPVLAANTRVTVAGAKLVLEGADGKRFEFVEEPAAR